jgi:hypothetical protein
MGDKQDVTHLFFFCQNGRENAVAQGLSNSVSKRK